MSSVRTSEFKEEKLLLKVLVEGDANLYSYTENDLNRYFYKTKSTKIKPLEYKIYKNSKGTISKNRNYLYQLKNKLTCKNLSSKQIKYSKSSLVKYFINYNNCKGNINPINYTSGTKGDFNIYAKIAAGISSLKIFNKLSDINIDFDSKNSFRFGLEFEYVFGFNNNKWALLLEPTYQSYSAEQKFYPGINNVVIQEKAIIDFSSIEIPIGVRYYLFNNKQNKIFLNLGILLEIPLSGEYKRERTDGSQVEPPLKINSSTPSTFIGTGYTLKNKYRIELRYNLNRNILNDSASWNTNFSNFSIKVGYNIF